MTNIKVVGILVFTISLILAILSSHISNETKLYNELINNINQKKAFTQEISKNIFYIYKNSNSSTQYLETTIKKFLSKNQITSNTTNQLLTKYIDTHNKKISKLWNGFFKKVQDFRNISHTTTAYSNILLEKTVSDIYTTNLMLIVEFDKLTQSLQKSFSNSLEMYKFLQYILFFILLLLLIYLFTQVKAIIAFVHKFLTVSKNIITNSSIKSLEPIEIEKNSFEISQAVQNFNYLVQKIDSSIQHSSDSIKHSYESFEVLEQRVEELLELLSHMDENEIVDKELTKKEDIIIQSLEELTSSAHNLQELKKDLENLLTYKNNK